MSDNNLSPVNYINKVFGETCQELSMVPQEVVGLLLFEFLQVEPEERGVLIARLKTRFNEFSAEADFDEVLKTINGAIDEAELKLTDWLMNAQDRADD